jgi:hypothetical protein
MADWIGHRCGAPGCEERACRDIRTLPLCYEHGLEIARVYEARIMADCQRETEAATDRRFRRFLVKQGNEGGDPVVYYVRIGDYIKIGFSTRLRNRLASLRADELLAVEPGGPEMERQRHKEFASERIDLRRENFRPSERLEAHIEAVRAEHGLPHWATLPRTSEITVRKIGEPK